MPITAAQCRAARALLDWTQSRLAEASQVGNATIRNFEGGKAAPQSSTLAALRRALEAEGIEFINGDSPGIKYTADHNRLMGENARLRSKIEAVLLRASPIVRAKVSIIAAEERFNDVDTLSLLRQTNENLRRRCQLLISSGDAKASDFEYS